ncbi:MAG: hypothetical protein AB7I18_11425 [Candidatus Berkiella sp.]
MALSAKATIGWGALIFGAVALAASGPFGLAAAEALVVSALLATVLVSLIYASANSSHSGFFFWPTFHRPIGGVAHSRTFVPTGPRAAPVSHSRTFIPTPAPSHGVSHSRTFIPSGGPSIGGGGFFSSPSVGAVHGMTHTRTFIPTGR